MATNHCLAFLKTGTIQHFPKERRQMPVTTKLPLQSFENLPVNADTTANSGSDRMNSSSQQDWSFPASPLSSRYGPGWDCLWQMQIALNIICMLQFITRHASSKSHFSLQTQEFRTLHKAKRACCYLQGTQTIWFFYLPLPLDWNDFSSVCSKPDLKSGPRGNRKVDPLSCSVVVCFFLHVISHF